MKNNDTTNIVETLIEQHRSLQKILGDINTQLFTEKKDFSKITKLLNEFMGELAKHLDLENKVFYPKLLEKMNKNGQDTKNTELFIFKMKDIENIVINFANKYKAADSIESKLESFSAELLNIIATLNIRIESEEEGIYAYWEMS